MIHHLDNAENVGPKSEDAKAEWRRRKKRPATINENHARELLELHTVSPNSGYTQDNITELALIKFFTISLASSCISVATWLSL